MNNFISAGYLPCVTKSSRKTVVKHTRFVPLHKNSITFDKESDESSSDDDDSSDDDSSAKLAKYSGVSACISIYIANIKGI
jgi:hypothetical protein